MDYDPVVEDSPPSKRRRKEEPRAHPTGCARAEGYYKLDSKEKAKHKSHFARCVADDSRAAAEAAAVSCEDPNKLQQFPHTLLSFQSTVRAVGLATLDTGSKMQASSREARSNQRRLLTAFGLENDSDLLKFNQLKVKMTTGLRFAESSVLYVLFMNLSVSRSQAQVRQVSHPRLGSFRHGAHRSG